MHMYSWSYVLTCAMSGDICNWCHSVYSFKSECFSLYVSIRCCCHLSDWIFRNKLFCRPNIFVCVVDRLKYFLLSKYVKAYDFFINIHTANTLSHNPLLWFASYKCTILNIEYWQWKHFNLIFISWNEKVDWYYF